MTGNDLKKAVEAVGNGGLWATVYRVSVWAFGVMFTVVGYFSITTLNRIEANQKVFATAITRLEGKQGVLANEVENLKDRTASRYTADQAIADWRAQDRRDTAQDKDRERLERRLETEINRSQ